MLALLACVAVPASASAGTELQRTWSPVAETCGGHDGSERGSGQIDASGMLYLPCTRSTEYGFDHHIGVFDAAGNKVRRIDLEFDRDGHNYRATDVAPSPDGSFLYVMRFSDLTVYRFDRQADGRYVARSQAEWSLANFPGTGNPCVDCKPRGQFLATDAAGSIYLSAGLWTCLDGSPHCTENAIVKYGANGAFVTRFGRKLTNSWALGDAHGSFGGVAVTADGRRVFVTDINNSRVQRFDRAADGSYGAVLAMGMNQASDPDRWGACYQDGVLAAPYDVALSPRGEVQVINTTCYSTNTFYADRAYGTVEVQRFGQDGTIRGSILSNTAAGERIHGMAVDRSGGIHLVQGKVVLRPAGDWSDAGADAGGGGPMGGNAVIDTTAPTLASITAPATITAPARTVTVTLGATDNVGITQMRLRVDGALQGWQPYAASFQHTLADRTGDHALAVQLRDAAGNVSNERGVTVRRNAVVAPAPSPTPTPTPDPTPDPDDDGPTVDGGGGGSSDRTRPVIRSVGLPVQVFRGRTATALVRASDDVGVTQVRFSVGNGRWGAWQSVLGKRRVMLPTGVGWKGVLTQVRDAAGNRSTPWFQPVFVAPRGAAWRKGTTRADSIRTFGRTQHIDSSNYDRKVDRISCGAGYDTVLAQPEDKVSRNCERVQRFRTPAF